MTIQQKITDSPVHFAEDIINDVKNSKDDGVAVRNVHSNMPCSKTFRLQST